MFKSLYKKLVIDIIGEYIENFDENTVEVNRWEGVFKKDNLILKSNALDNLSYDLGLPVKVKYGLIKTLEISIEWDKLLSSPKPPQILIQELHIVCEFSHDFCQDFASKLKINNRNGNIEKKFKKISKKVFPEDSDVNIKINLAWKGKFLKSLMENINIKIENIHIRFEEDYRSKKFNFGLIINLFELINTNKNEEEHYYDYETRRKLGRSFYIMKFIGFSIYFNTSYSNLTQFVDIKDQNLINYIKPSTNSYNHLPPVYEHFFDFSSNFFNHHSFEYNKQYFIINPMDFQIKFRKSTNAYDHSLPSTSAIIQISEININFNDYIINDLFYLQELKKYHSFTNIPLGVKKTFLHSKFSKVGYMKLFKNGIQKVIENIKESRRGRVCKLTFYNRLRNIGNYQNMFHNVLMNENKYTSSKLSNEKLFSCKINNKIVLFQSYNELQSEFRKIEAELDEKLIYLIRLKQLFIFKNYLIKELKTTTEKKGNTIMGGFLRLFGKSKEIAVKEVNFLNESILNQPENDDLIDNIISGKINDMPELITDISKVVKRNVSLYNIRIDNISVNIHENKESFINFRIDNLFYQFKRTNISTKSAILLGKFLVIDQSLGSTKFSYLFCPSNESQKLDHLSLALKKSVYDYLIFDQDGIYEILTRKKLNKFNSFLTIYKKSFINELNLKEYKNSFFYKYTTLIRLQSFDLFFNLMFIDKLLSFTSNLILPQSTFTNKMNESYPSSDMFIPDNPSVSIDKFNYFDLTISKSRFFLPFSIDEEDYRSYLLELEKVEYTSKAFDKCLNILNISLLFYNNFLLVINNVQNLTFNTIVKEFSIFYNEVIKDSLRVHYLNILNEINLTFDKTLFFQLSDLFLIFNNHLTSFHKNLSIIFRKKEMKSSPTLIHDVSNNISIDQFEHIKLKSLYNDYPLEILDNNSNLEEFKEVFEDISDNSIIEVKENSKIIYTVPINKETFHINLKSVQFRLEIFSELNLDKESSKYLVFSFSDITLHIDKCLNTSIVEKRLAFKSFDIFLESLNMEKDLINQENIHFILYHKQYINKDSVIELDINIGKLLIKNTFIKELINFNLLILTHYSNLTKEENQPPSYNSEQTNNLLLSIEDGREFTNNTMNRKSIINEEFISNKQTSSNMLLRKLKVNLALNSLEYFIDEEKSIFLSSIIRFENYLNKSLKVLIHKLEVCDSLQTFSLNIGDNIDLAEENSKINFQMNYPKNSIYLTIIVLNLHLDHKVTNYLKDLHSLEKYMNFVKNSIEKTKKVKETVENKQDQSDLVFNIIKLNFTVNLHQNFKIQMENNNLNILRKNSILEIGNENHKVFLYSSNIVKSKEFFNFGKLICVINNNLENLTIFIDNIVFNVKFIDILISRPINKLLMNLNQMISIMTSLEKKIPQRNDKKNTNLMKMDLALKISNIDINLFDVFLKENIENSTTNDKFVLNLKIFNITYEKNHVQLDKKDPLNIFKYELTQKDSLGYSSEIKGEFNILLQSTSAKLIKPLKKKSMPLIGVSMISNKSLIIDLNNINVIISEQIFTLEKMYRKYSTLINYVSRNELKSNSNSKDMNLIISLLHLSFLKINIKDINFKMKKAVLSESYKNNINLGFGLEFDIIKNTDTRIDCLISYGAKVSDIQLFSKIRKNEKYSLDNLNYQKEYFIYPFEINLTTHKYKDKLINIEISLIEVDLSMKKLAILSNILKNIKEFGSFKSKRKTGLDSSKRGLLQLLLFDYRMKLSMKKFVIIFAKEEIGRIYNPLFSVELDNFYFNVNQSTFSLKGEMISEYFNNFNEYWEPFLEKSTISLEYKDNRYIIDFHNNVNCNISLACVKVIETFVEESKNFNYYKDSIMVEDYNIMIIKEEESSGNISMAKTSFSKKNNKLDYLNNKDIQGTNSLSQVLVPKINRLNNSTNINVYNLQEKLNSNINFYMQIKNFTGVELHLISVEKNEIIKKIMNVETISLQDLIKSSELSNLTSSKYRISKVSSNSSIFSGISIAENYSEFKSSAQDKYRKQNEKINSIKSVKYLYFKLPSLNMNLSINLFKPYQEIEIYKERDSNHKIIVEINIDTFGRKIIYIKSPIIIKNNLKTEIQVLLSEKEDINDKNNFSINIKPFSESFVPLTHKNFEYLRVRPYQDKEMIKFYQNFKFSDVYTKESLKRSKGKLLKCFNKDENNYFHLVCYNTSNEYSSNQNNLVFDYSLEINNILPYDLLFHLDKEMLSNTDLLFKKNLFYLSKSFSLSLLNTYTIEESKEYLYITLNNQNTNQTKMIEINKIRHNDHNHEDTLDFKDQLETIKFKVLYKIVNKKLKVVVWADFLIINELHNNINIILDKSVEKKVYGLKGQSSSSKEEKRVCKKRERIFSIESDLLTSNKSRTFVNEQDMMRNDMINKEEISVSLIEMKSKGMRNLLEKYYKMLENTKSDETKLSLNQEINTFDTLHLLENQNKQIGFMYIPLITEQHKSNITKNNSFKLVCLNNETVLFQIDNSIEILANYIRDDINVCKNHYLNFTFHNKNQLDILTNIKNLNELLVPDAIDSLREFFSNSNQTEHCSLTKIINLSPKYLIINKSNLNLFITQEQCFDQGFYVIYPFSKLIFKWINFDKPFLVKLKTRDSFFTKSFPLENIADYYLNLRTTNKNLIIKVSIIENLGTTIVYIQDSTNEPPMYIENLSNFVVKISEKSLKSENNLVLNPLMSNSFCLEDNSNNIEVYICQSLESLDGNYNFKYVTSFSLEEKVMTKKYSNIKIKLKKNENMEMNYSLVIKDLVSVESEIDSHENELFSFVEGSKHEDTQMIEYKIIFNSIGISFIDHTPKEISYLFLNNIEFSINKLKAYLKLRFQVESIQIDNCLKDPYYKCVMNTPVKNKKISSIRLMVDLNYNSLGNTFFINNCNIETNSKIYIKVDGIYLSEMLNFIKNLKKIVSKDNLIKTNTQYNLVEKQYMLSQEKTSIKVFINKLTISNVSISFSFKTFSKMMNYFTPPYLKFLMIFNIENMEILLARFETSGTKSLETVNMMLGKSFVNKNSILIEYLYSTGIFLNFNNLFKYAFGSIMEIMKMKRKQSLFMLAKQMFYDYSLFSKHILIWIKRNMNTLINVMKMLFLSYHIQVNVLSDFELKTKNNIFLYNSLTERTKQKFQSSYYNSKKMFFLTRRCMNIDRNRFMTISMTLQNIRNYRGIGMIKYQELLYGTFLWPLKCLFSPFLVVSNYLSNYLKEEENKKMIRYPRYISKNTTKIEHYSESRALANQDILKNKKNLNILEDIENYYNLSNNDSVILTNLRLIYVDNRSREPAIKIIEFESIYYIDYSIHSRVIKLFYFDENYTKSTVNKENLNDETYYFKFNFKRKLHLALKMFELKANGFEKDIEKLNKIYEFVKENYPFKMTKKSLIN